MTCEDAGVLGLIAGRGDLPLRVIEACRATGRPCFVLALRDQADPAVVEGSDHAWVRLGAAGEGLRRLHAAGVVDLVMAGGVRRPGLFDLLPDRRAVRFLAKVGLKALGDDGLLRAVVGELEAEGFRVLGVDDLLPDLLAPRGVLGRHAPDAMAREDIRRGAEVAAGLGRLDVGQAAVVQQGIVLGVEAVEGTDGLLARCAALRREGPGGVLVKMRKPQQERRADLPAVGSDTVTAAVAAGLRGIALEAGATLVVDRPAMVRAADTAGLFVVGVGDDGEVPDGV